MGSPSLPGKKVERKREVIGEGEYRRESEGKRTELGGDERREAKRMNRSRCHTIPYILYSFNNVADIRNLQQYCSIEHYQSGRTKVYDSYIVKET